MGENFFQQYTFKHLPSNGVNPAFFLFREFDLHISISTVLNMQSRIKTLGPMPKDHGCPLPPNEARYPGSSSR